MADMDEIKKLLTEQNELLRQLVEAATVEAPTALARAVMSICETIASAQPSARHP